MAFLNNGDFKLSNLTQQQLNEEVDMIRSIIKRHMFYSTNCEMAKTKLVLAIRNPNVIIEVELNYNHTYDIHKEYELKMSKEEVLIDGLFEELLKLCSGINSGTIVHTGLSNFARLIEFDVLKQINTSLILKKEASIVNLTTDLYRDTIDPEESFKEFLNPNNRKELTPITDETWQKESLSN